MLAWVGLVSPVLSPSSSEVLDRGQSLPLPEQLIKIYTNHFPYWSSHSGPLNAHPKCPRGQVPDTAQHPAALEMIQISETPGRAQNLAQFASSVTGQHPSAAAVYPCVTCCGPSLAAFSFEFCLPAIQASVCCVSPSEETSSPTIGTVSRMAWP